MVRPFAADTGTVGGWTGPGHKSILLEAAVEEAAGHVGWEFRGESGLEM